MASRAGAKHLSFHQARSKAFAFCFYFIYSKSRILYISLSRNFQFGGLRKQDQANRFST